MHKWTSCRYDASLNLAEVTVVEGGTNPRRMVTFRSQSYERDHKGCTAIEVEGGVENCPIGLVAEE
ncbi:hypothetical protein, partial [Corallococcus praedator]|uniref:hypothetical protein n=1 Tax=Corallococcus praedator TaxID=2316724 RepID=UPI001ABF7971